MDLFNASSEYLLKCVQEFLKFTDPYGAVAVGGFIMLLLAKKLWQRFR